ncbi:MAG: sigma-70 family RNA polymerase sigma factor [Actinobacteria bacterium]|nr:sigma-70 family RNA polymerase sigma factor [Actinomycetota bacterium]
MATALWTRPLRAHWFNVEARPAIAEFEKRAANDTPDDLLVRVGLDDREAFSRLYDIMSSLVYGLALRITRSRMHAEEVTQEVFVQVWSQAARFDPASGSARAWVSTIAHRRSVDVVRRSQSTRNREEGMNPEPDRTDIAEDVVEADERERVRSALSELSDLQRQAIEMAYFGGMTYRQVAEALGTPLGTVKTRMRDGLARIREIMEGEDG